MRVRRSVPLGVALTIIALAACSKDYGSDDPTLAPDASIEAAGEKPIPDSATTMTLDAPMSDAAQGNAPFPPPCDKTVDLAQISCGGSAQPSCASGLGGNYPGDKVNDLVACDKFGNPTCVMHCPQGCAAMPAGYGDFCDPCFDKADGFYCAADLKGASPDVVNAGVVVDCQAGRKLDQSVCGTSKCESACTRTEPPPVFPSCCR